VRIRRDCIRRPANPSPRTYTPLTGVAYRVRDGESWVTIALKNQLDPWGLIRFNYPNLPADPAIASLEVNWYLQEYVGCRELTSDGCNYIFSSTANPGVIYVRKPPARSRIPASLRSATGDRASRSRSFMAR
jgi:hypothetical protein